VIRSNFEVVMLRGDPCVANSQHRDPDQFEVRRVGSSHSKQTIDLKPFLKKNIRDENDPKSHFKPKHRTDLWLLISCVHIHGHPVVPISG
jgi:hypothetical protein